MNLSGNGWWFFFIAIIAVVVLVSLFLFYHWNKYGYDLKTSFWVQIVYLAGILILLSFSLMALTGGSI